MTLGAPLCLAICSLVSPFGQQEEFEFPDMSFAGQAFVGKYETVGKSRLGTRLRDSEPVTIATLNPQTVQTRTTEGEFEGGEGTFLYSTDGGAWVDIDGILLNEDVTYRLSAIKNEVIAEGILRRAPGLAPFIGEAFGFSILKGGGTAKTKGRTIDDLQGAELVSARLEDDKWSVQYKVRNGITLSFLFSKDRTRLLRFHYFVANEEFRMEKKVDYSLHQKFGENWIAMRVDNEFCAETLDGDYWHYEVSQTTSSLRSVKMTPAGEHRMKFLPNDGSKFLISDPNGNTRGWFVFRDGKFVPIKPDGDDN